MTRRKEDRGEEEYLRRTDGLPAEQAAAIAVEISRAIQQEEAARYNSSLADEQGD